MWLVDVGLVSIHSLKKLRSYWPKKEYTNLKNRKSARMQRLIKRKNDAEFASDYQRLKM